MSKKKLRITISIIISIMICVTIVSVISSESKKIKICLNGWVLSSSKNIVSSGQADNGPWLILKNENGYYEYMSNRGVRFQLKASDEKFMPRELVEFYSINSEAIRVDIDAGHFIYVISKDSSIAAWSITL